MTSARMATSFARSSSRPTSARPETAREAPAATEVMAVPEGMAEGIRRAQVAEADDREAIRLSSELPSTAAEEEDEHVEEDEPPPAGAPARLASGRSPEEMAKAAAIFQNVLGLPSVAHADEEEADELDEDEPVDDFEDEPAPAGSFRRIPSDAEDGTHGPPVAPPLASGRSPEEMAHAAAIFQNVLGLPSVAPETQAPAADLALAPKPSDSKPRAVVPQLASVKPQARK